jgi:hypothetical protein
MANRSAGFSQAPRMATWRSGYAAVCKTVYPGSIPGVASTHKINGLVDNAGRKFRSKKRSLVSRGDTVTACAAAARPCPACHGRRNSRFLFRSERRIRRLGTSHAWRTARILLVGGETWKWVTDGFTQSASFATGLKPRPATISPWRHPVSSDSNRPPTRRRALTSNKWRIALWRKRSNCSRTALPPAEQEASDGVFDPSPQFSMPYGAAGGGDALGISSGGRLHGLWLAHIEGTPPSNQRRL